MDKTNDDNVIERIRQAYKNLSKAQMRIADIILNQGYAASFMSITDLASLAGTTNVTIVSFSRNLGFSGFAELKKSLQEYYRWKVTAHIDSSHTLPERINTIPENRLQELLSKAISSEVNLLVDTYNNLIQTDILQAVEYIADAKKVFLVSGGVIRPVAHMLEQRLSAIRKETVLMTIDNYSLLPAIIENATTQDVFIVYSFPHYRMMIGGIAKCARIRGAKVICITDSNTSPPAPYADIIILCRSSSLMFYNSITAATSISNIIATLLVAKTKQDFEHDKQILKVLSDYMTSLPYFSDIETLPST